MPISDTFMNFTNELNFQNMSKKSRSTLQEIYDTFSVLNVYNLCPPDPNDHEKVFSCVYLINLVSVFFIVKVHIELVVKHIYFDLGNV